MAKKKKEPKKIKLRGRPSSYTHEMASEICARLSEGEPLTKICKSKDKIIAEALAKGIQNPVLPINDMPSYATVMNWLFARNKDGTPKYPEFLDMYARARDIQADYMADEIVQVADEDPIIYREDGKPATFMGKVILESAHHIKNRIDARKWIAAKLKPRKYSDKVLNEHTGKDGGPIEVKPPPDERDRLIDDLLAKEKMIKD